MRTGAFRGISIVSGAAALLLANLGLMGCAVNYASSGGPGGDQDGSVTVGAQGTREGRPALDRSTPPPVGPAPSLDLPEIHEFLLGNGLTVLVIPRDEVPIVSVSLQLPGGATAQRPEEAGLAALVAEMLEEGTAVRSAFQIADELDRLGASLDSYATPDASGVDLQVLSSRLDPALDLMAEVVLDPAFPQEELERIRQQRLTRILQGRDEARVLADEAFDRTLYGDRHPYGLPGIGTEETLESFGREDVVRFHAERYEPSGAVLVVAGDVEPAAVEARAEALFGAWQPGRAPLPEAPEPPPVDDFTIYLVDKPGAAQSEIRLGRVAMDARDPDYFALNVMNTVLGGAFTSRLNIRLREEKGYTYGAMSGFARRTLPGPFTALAAVYTPVTDSAVVEFVREIRRMADEPVPAEELTRARNFVAYRLPRELETTRDLAGRIAEARIYQLPETFYQEYVDRTLSVSAEDVQGVARRWLDLSRMSLVIAGDRALIEEPLRDLGLGRVVVLETPGSPPAGEGGAGR